MAKPKPKIRSGNAGQRKTLADNARPLLPEKIRPADLKSFNEALKQFFARLRDVRRLPPGEMQGRPGAKVALAATSEFLLNFDVVRAESFQVPLLGLQSALRALDDNNAVPLLKPTRTSAGGRAPDSPARQALIGIAVGAVGRLRWTQMKPAKAHEAVADVLNEIGIKPGRGSGRIKPRTIREWCGRVAADVGRQSISAINADEMMTDEWRQKIAALSKSKARRFAKAALHQVVETIRDDAHKTS